MRRVETDSDAVHITTVHSAKGLEYPIVLVPFAYTERPSATRPYVFNDERGRVVDVASWVAWGDGADEGSKEASAAAKERKRLATVEVDGDALRLLYVALTRAKHHLEMWWAPTRRAGTSALGRLLLDRWGAGTVFNSPLGDAYEKADPAAASKQIDALVAASNGTIARFDVPLEQPVRTPLPLPAAPASLLAVANAGGPSPARRSGVADLVVHRAHRRLLAALAGDRRRVATRRRRLRRGARRHRPGRRRRRRRRRPRRRRRRRCRSPMRPPAARRSARRARSPRTGRLHVADADRRHRTRLVAAASRRPGSSSTSPAIADGFAAAVDTPLGALFDGRPLADFSAADRLAELTFDLTFGSAQRSPRPTSARCCRRRSTPPIRCRTTATTWHRRWRSPSSPGGSPARSTPCSASASTGPRFVVVDYKSNRLHEPRCDRPARRLPTGPARRGDDAQPLPAAGRAVLRRPAPLPRLAARRRVLPRSGTSVASPTCSCAA